MAIEELKEQMIEEIKKKGLPVLFIRGEADSDYGILVEPSLKVRLCGYASDFFEGDKRTVDYLRLIDLAYLLEEGITSDKKDYKEMLEQFEEEEDNED